MTTYRIPGPLCVTTSEPIDAGTMCRARSLPPTHVDGGMAAMNATDRIAGAVRRAARQLPSESAGKLLALLSPEVLASLAAVLVIWAGSHAVGVGEAVDLLLLGTGLIFLGSEALDAVSSLGQFAQTALSARCDADLDAAGRHLARAVAIIGINTVLVLLTRGAVKAYRGRYQPKVTGDASLRAGEGFTTKFGDITYSTAGSAADRALVLYHEQVHAALSPKLMRFRELRADIRMTGISGLRCCGTWRRPWRKVMLNCESMASGGCLWEYAFRSPMAMSRSALWRSKSVASPLWLAVSSMPWIWS